LDPKLDGNRFITGFEVLAGNTSLVHHVLAYSVNPAQVVGRTQDGQPITNAQAMEALQQASGGNGSWPCFGAAGEGVVPEGLTLTWAPGTGVTHYPAGTGLALPQGHQIVMQVHYHLHEGNNHLHAGLAESDQTRVRLALARSVERPAISGLPDLFLATRGTPQETQLPPGQEAVSTEWTLPGQWVAEDLAPLLGGVKPSRFDVYGIFPHMHGTGRELSASFDGEGTSTCAAQVPRWDYHWQQMYFYDAPVSWSASQSLHVKCTYDTRGRTSPTLPGLGTNDEMCLFGLYLVPVP
jgi:hypothetical protein